MYPETWHPTSPMMTGMTRMYQGPQLQRLWGGIASSYAGAGRQAAATAPIYEASQAKWERGLELGRYGAGAAVREQFLGRIPGMTMPERPLVEAQSEEAQAAARLGVSRGARVSAQAAQDKMEADQRKDNANNGRLLQRQRELEGKTYQVLNTNGTSGTNYENLSKAEMQELKDLRSGKGYTGASTNEVEEKKNQVIKSYTQEIEDLRASHASTQKRIAAEKTVAESYMQIAQQQFGEARTEARKAADAIMERRKGIGQLQEGEFAQLQIATNMALAGADPRVMPPGFRDMVRSGLGGRRAQQSLLSRERALGSQRIDMMGAENVEGGDEGQLKFWNRILGVAAGTTPSAEGQPGLPNIREQRMKLSEADFQMLKDSVLYDKEMVKLLTSMDRAMKQIADFGVQIKEGERAANKNAGNVPAGGIGPGQKQAVGGQ